MGVDVINSVQVSAKDMDTKRLKKEFGKDITFWGGGCDTREVLPFGSQKINHLLKPLLCLLSQNLDLGQILQA